MINKCRRIISVFICLYIFVFTFTSCQRKEEASSSNYIMSSIVELSEEVTNVSKFIIQNDMIYICATIDENQTSESTTYIATMLLDGSQYKQFSENLDRSYELRDFVLDETGNVWAIGTLDSRAAVLLHFDEKGTLVQTIDLPMVTVADILVDHNVDLFINLDSMGNIYVTVKYIKTYVYVFDDQAQYLFSLENNLNPMRAITTAEGNVAVCASDGTTSYALLTVDIGTQGWSNDIINLNTVFDLYGGASNSFYVFDSSYFYAFDAAEQSKELIFKWTDLGLSTGDIHVRELPDGKFLVLTGTFSQTGLYSYELITLEPGEDKRTILTMKSIQPSLSVLEAVSQFNKTNQEYKVDLFQYFSSYDNVSDKDWNTALSDFNMEIISGTIPDIMDLSNMPINIYFERDILEDLYGYIRESQDINMENYFDNIIDAFAIDDRLPYITNGVYIATYLADSRIVGSESGWTYDDALTLMNQYEVSGLSRGFFLEMVVEQNSDSFINWGKKENYFDSPEFIRVLELAATISENRTASFSGAAVASVAAYQAVMSVYDIAMYNNLYQGNLAPIGLPNDKGITYHTAFADSKIGMSALGENKSGAWAFVRTFLEEKQQMSSYFLPIHKAAFETVMIAAMNNNSILSWNYQGEVTQRDVDVVKLLLTTTHYSVNENTTIVDIVNEEAAAYFSGSRTAEEVATIIQDRVQTYINNQS